MFTGEGHRKVYARLNRKKGIRVGKKRILRLMREHNLLSPHRMQKAAANTHDGVIITHAPNEMWATDGAKVETSEDGWVWVFWSIEHWNAECMGWNVSKKGDRFAALEAIAMGVEKVCGKTGADVLRGLRLRMDHGSQYRSEDFLNQIRYWGIKPSMAFVKEPETNGVVERFNRTFKEQVVYGRSYRTAEELREAVRVFVETYNDHWLLEKMNYKSPHEARAEWNQKVANSALLSEGEGATATLIGQRPSRGGNKIIAKPGLIHRAPSVERATATLIGASSIARMK
jgi:transposase InsO family protein